MPVIDILITVVIAVGAFIFVSRWKKRRYAQGYWQDDFGQWYKVGPAENQGGSVYSDVDSQNVGEEVEEKRSKFYWVKFGLLMALLMAPLVFTGYSLWQSNMVAKPYQVALECTVLDAGYRSSGDEGSLREDLYFVTDECGDLYMPLNGSEDPEALLGGIHMGKRYEFMVFHPESGVVEGERRAFSFSGPVE